MSHIVLVTGSRFVTDRARVFAALDAVHAERAITLVVHGACRGADMLADAWAHEREIDAIALPADWRKHGKAAGPIRNIEMLEQHAPDIVLAFPIVGGVGTQHCMRAAVERHIPVMIGWVLADHGVDYAIMHPPQLSLL